MQSILLKTKNYNNKSQIFMHKLWSAIVWKSFPPQKKILCSISV